jgi:hypothetical protein
MYAWRDRPSIPPEKLFAGAVAADALLGAIGTAADGGDPLQHAVPLIRGAESGRRGVGCNQLHEERGPAVGSRSCEGVPEACRGIGAGAGFTSNEHFTVDGTLLKAWASLKSFQPKDQKGRTPPDDLGNPTVDFHVERRPTRRTRRRAIRTRCWRGKDRARKRS